MISWPWDRSLSSWVICDYGHEQHAVRCMCIDMHCDRVHFVSTPMYVIVSRPTTLCVGLLRRLERRARSSRAYVFGTPLDHVQRSARPSTLDAVRAQSMSVSLRVQCARAWIQHCQRALVFVIAAYRLMCDVFGLPFSSTLVRRVVLVMSRTHAARVDACGGGARLWAAWAEALLVLSERVGNRSSTLH